MASQFGNPAMRGFPNWDAMRVNSNYDGVAVLDFKLHRRVEYSWLQLNPTLTSTMSLYSEISRFCLDNQGNTWRHLSQFIREYPWRTDTIPNSGTLSSYLKLSASDVTDTQLHAQVLSTRINVGFLIPLSYMVLTVLSSPAPCTSLRPGRSIFLQG